MFDLRILVHTTKPLLWGSVFLPNKSSYFPKGRGSRRDRVQLTSTLWVLCLSVRCFRWVHEVGHLSFLFLFPCPSSIPFNDLSLSLSCSLPLSTVWGWISPVLCGSCQAGQIWRVLQAHSAHSPHRQYGGDDLLRWHPRGPAANQ